MIWKMTTKVEATTVIEMSVRLSVFDTLRLVTSLKRGRANFVVPENFAGAAT